MTEDRGSRRTSSSKSSRRSSGTAPDHVTYSEREPRPKKDCRFRDIVGLDGRQDQKSIVRIESPRESFLRRKSSERPPEHKTTSLPQFIGNLLGGWSSRRGSVEESEDDVREMPTEYLKILAEEKQRVIDHADRHIQPGSSTNLLPQLMGSVEFPSRGTFLFSEPSLQSESLTNSESIVSLESRLAVCEFPSITGSQELGKANLFISDYHSLPDIELISNQRPPSSEWSKLGAQTQELFTTLPSEIIRQIYLYLHPMDFNSSRHTCRSWMNASLDRSLQVLMLRRAAWWSSAECEVRERIRRMDHLSPRRTNEAWLMSCLVSRECALAAGWKGNGLNYLNTAAIATCDHHWGCCPKPSCRNTRTTYSKHPSKIEVFKQTARVDFSDLASGYAPTGQSGGLIFQASMCGKHLLVAEGGMIYLYELYGDDIHALTSVICPRRVLAMSMDVSSRRFAIAALLDGRMGIMCDLTLTLTTRSMKQTGFSAQSGAGEESSANTFEVISPGGEEEIVDDFSVHGRERGNINQTWNVHLPYDQNLSRISPKGKEVEQSLPIETGPRSLYYQLCSDEDPPRSVAICPQRDCVAFGCSSGLELHWVDGLTGQDLNRWFPLTGPSDYLYFLPPRRGVDSPRKLRLISSAAHPSQRPAIARKFAQARGRNQKPFWGSTGFGNRIPSAVGFVSDCDHYRAVPMSDGFHVLFADPDSGMLCLGSDAPIGDPRRLLRKIMLVPPVEGAIPRLYTSSTMEGSKAPRIIAAFDDQIFIYSIPSDIFELSRKEQSSGGLSDPDIATAAPWLEWWPKDDIPANYPKLNLKDPETDLDSSPHSIWPLFIRSTYVGRLPGLVDMAVNDITGKLSIWGFSLGGEALVWQMDDGIRPGIMKERDVAEGGRILEVYEIDADGDVVMG